MTSARSALLLVAVFLSGAAVMVVEMTTVRILQPTFGSTTYVWTNVIAVVLAALAVGYAIGGRIADRRASESLYYGMMAVGGLLVAATVPAATPFCRWLLPVDVNLENVASFLMRGSLVATLVLFAPPLVLLGMLSPVAIRLLADGGVGRAAGRVYAIGTIGSIAGTYLPTLWLVPAYGSRTTMLVAAATLVAPAALGLVIASSGRKGAALAVAAIVGWAGTRAFAETRPDRGAPKLPDGGVAVVREERETPYQYVTVREDTFPGTPPVTFRILNINEGVFTYHSFERSGSALTGQKYYDDYALLPLLLDLPRGEELRVGIVGLACGVTARQLRHFWQDEYRLKIEGAEIDPVVIELGRRYFALPPEGDATVRAHAIDGRQLLEAMPAGATHHAIVVDAFAQELYVPFHLATREFFELCRRRLAPGGVLAMNVYAYRPDSPNLAALENTLATVFGQCIRVRQFWGSNFLLLARNAAEAPEMLRLFPSRAAARFGSRRDVAEWDELLRQAVWLPEHSTLIEADPAKKVLTDDDSPLEYMTDTFIEETEREALGR